VTMVAAEAVGSAAEAAGAGAETGAAAAGEASAPRASKAPKATRPAPTPSPQRKQQQQQAPQRKTRQRPQQRTQQRTQQVRKTLRKGHKRWSAFNQPQKIVLAEFVLCMVIVALRPFGKADPKGSTEGTFVEGSAIMAVFFVLALLTAGGKSSASAKTAAAFGLLVTTGVIFRNQQVFTQLGGFFRDAGKQRDKAKVAA
jgi:hypothetical protein